MPLKNDVETVVQFLLDHGVLSEDGCSQLAGVIRGLQAISGGASGTPQVRRSRRSAGAGNQRAAKGQIPADIKAVLGNRKMTTAEIVNSLLEKSNYAGRDRSTFYTSVFQTLKRKTDEFSQDAQKRWRGGGSSRRTAGGKKRSTKKVSRKKNTSKKKASNKKAGGKRSTSKKASVKKKTKAKTK